MEYKCKEYCHDTCRRAMLRYDCADSARVIPRPYKKLVWNSGKNCIENSQVLYKTFWRLTKKCMCVGQLSRWLTKKYIRYWLNFAKNMAQCKASPTRNDETISEILL